MTKTKTITTSILSLTVISLMFTGAMQSQAYAVPLTIQSASAEWTAVHGGVNITGLGTNEVHWGIPVSEDAGLNRSSQRASRSWRSKTFSILNILGGGWSSFFSSA